MNMMFKTKRGLKDYVQFALDNSASPAEFEQWLNDHAGKLYVMDDKEPYSASELAELV